MNWLNTLNSTNWKAVMGAFYAAVVIVSACAMELFTDRHFDSTVLGLLLAFAASAAGFSYLQFAKKRETEILVPPETTAENATGSPAPAATPEAEVRRTVAQPTSTPTVAAEGKPEEGRTALVSDSSSDREGE